MRAAFVFILLTFLISAWPGTGLAEEKLDPFWNSYHWNYMVQPGPRSYFWEHPPTRPDFNRLPTPGLLPNSETLAITLHATLPFDRARLPRNGIVTFGWLPVDDPLFEEFPQTSPRVPIRYIVEIQREDRALFKLPQRHYPHKRHYTLLWKPPTPGSYVWWVRAQYDRHYEIPSLRRSFVVLPP